MEMNMEIESLIVRVGGEPIELGCTAKEQVQ